MPAHCLLPKLRTSNHHVTRSHHVPRATSSRASDPNLPDPSPQVSTTPNTKLVSHHTSYSLPPSFPKSNHFPLPLPIPLHPLHARADRIEREPHIILLPHINPPPISPNPQPLLLAHLPYLPIMFLVPERRRRRQEEGARHHGQQEGQPEGRERVFVQCDAVARRECVGGG